MLDGETVNSGKFSTLDQTLDCNYGIHIDSVHNDEADPTKVALPFNIFTSQDSPTYSSANIILPIVTDMHPDFGYREGVVLYPDFPVS